MQQHVRAYVVVARKMLLALLLLKIVMLLLLPLPLAQALWRFAPRKRLIDIVQLLVVVAGASCLPFAGAPCFVVAHVDVVMSMLTPP